MPFISSLRGTFGAQSKRNKFPPYITGVSGSVQGGSSFNLATQSITWSSAGEYYLLLFEHQFLAQAEEEPNKVVGLMAILEVLVDTLLQY